MCHSKGLLTALKLLQFPKWLEMRLQTLCPSKGPIMDPSKMANPFMSQPSNPQILVIFSQGKAIQSICGHSTVHSYSEKFPATDLLTSSFIYVAVVDSSIHHSSLRGPASLSLRRQDMNYHILTHLPYCIEFSMNHSPTNIMHKIFLNKLFYRSHSIKLGSTLLMSSPDSTPHLIVILNLWRH